MSETNYEAAYAAYLKAYGDVAPSDILAAPLSELRPATVAGFKAAIDYVLTAQAAELATLRSEKESAEACLDTANRSRAALFLQRSDLRAQLAASEADRVRLREENLRLRGPLAVMRDGLCRDKNGAYQCVYCSEITQYSDPEHAHKDTCPTAMARAALLAAPAPASGEVPVPRMMVDIEGKMHTPCPDCRGAGYRPTDLAQCNSPHPKNNTILCEKETRHTHQHKCGGLSWDATEPAATSVSKEGEI